mmetsp:Transcript_19538/g.27524  ORF Transcript_19538/g.27524 Transcript_19538/m.27524 type:complete len:255 (+) Transcript_19538:713-1477(+)
MTESRRNFSLLSSTLSTSSAITSAALISAAAAAAAAAAVAAVPSSRVLAPTPGSSSTMPAAAISVFESGIANGAFSIWTSMSCPSSSLAPTTVTVGLSSATARALAAAARIRPVACSGDESVFSMIFIKYSLSDTKGSSTKPSSSSAILMSSSSVIESETWELSSNSSFPKTAPATSPALTCGVASSLPEDDASAPTTAVATAAVAAAAPVLAALTASAVPLEAAALAAFFFSAISMIFDPSSSCSFSLLMSLF